MNSIIDNRASSESDGFFRHLFFPSPFFRRRLQDHDCDFDHKAKGKEILAKNNPNISIKGWAVSDFGWGGWDSPVSGLPPGC